MKKIFCAMLLMLSVGCSDYSDRDFSAVGKPLQVGVENPLTCPAYHSMDLKLGAIGVGGVFVPSGCAQITLTPVQYVVAKQAVEQNKFLKVVVDTARWNWCTHNNEATSVEIFELK